MAAWHASLLARPGLSWIYFDYFFPPLVHEAIRVTLLSRPFPSYHVYTHLYSPVSESFRSLASSLEIYLHHLQGAFILATKFRFFLSRC